MSNGEKTAERMKMNFAGATLPQLKTMAQTLSDHLHDVLDRTSDQIEHTKRVITEAHGDIGDEAGFLDEFYAAHKKAVEPSAELKEKPVGVSAQIAEKMNHCGEVVDAIKSGHQANREMIKTLEVSGD